MVKQKYLQQGEQTKITADILEITKNFKAKGLDLIIEILNWLHKNLQETEDNKTKIFRKRTAKEIIRSKFTSGCTDWALAFIVLARAKGMPAIYVETIRRRWLEIGKEEFIEGHVFVEVFIDKKWYIINPQDGSIKATYDKWIIFDRGLDSWDLDIKNFEDLKNKFLEFKIKYNAENKF